MRNVIRIVLVLPILTFWVWVIWFVLPLGLRLGYFGTPPAVTVMESFMEVSRILSQAIGIPLVVALVVGYIKKSKVIFWDTLVGAMVIMVIWPFTGIWPFTSGLL